jgi:dihydroneopterin aldolase
MNKDCKLTISDLRVWVKLGCSKEEKHHKQLVRFDVDLIFKGVPAAVETDKMDDTVCYFEAAEIIKSVCASKEFHLIEHLAHEAYLALNKALTNRELLSEISLTITKTAPPIEGVHGGVSFTYIRKLESRIQNN